MSMKTLYTLLGLLTAFFAQAQIEDRTETDCDGQSKSIYSTLETGTPIIIAAKGLDCSICQGQAPTVASFADESMGQVEVWGAMTYRYSNNTADCNEIDEWVQDFNWESVFAFPDADEFWSQSGVPFYHVISPTTLEIAYSGPFFSEASETALGLITVGLEEDFDKESFTLYNRNGNLNIQIKSSISGEGRIEVFNILGQNVFSKEFFLNEGELKIQTPFKQNSGIFIANLELNGATYSKKFLLKQ